MKDIDKIGYIFRCWDRLHRMLHGAANRELKMDSKPLMRDISGGQVHLLVTLDRISRGGSEGVTLGMLSKELGVTPASCSGMVDRLVKKGLIERRQDDEDRRRIRLVLSEKMAAEFRARHEHMMHGAEELLRKLDPELIDRWHGLMEEIATEIEQNFHRRAK